MPRRFAFPCLLSLAITACGTADKAPEPAVAEDLPAMLSEVAPDVPPAPPGTPERWPDPHAACAFLDTRGLPTEGYKHYYGVWWCVGTHTTSAPTGYGPADEVTYTASGTQHHLKEILVAAQHFNGNDEKVTRDRAARAARDVSERIFGDGGAPAEALAALQSGSKGGTWTVDGILVEVKRDNYPTGKGYGMDFRLRPAPVGAP
jgi:hypothetical protein